MKSDTNIKINQTPEEIITNFPEICKIKEIANLIDEHRCDLSSPEFYSKAESILEKYKNLID